MSYTVHCFPVGQPYTPPRDLTAEEIAQVIRYLASKGIEIQAKVEPNWHLVKCDN